MSSAGGRFLQGSCIYCQQVKKKMCAFLALPRQKPGFSGLRYRSGPAGALRAPYNPLRPTGLRQVASRNLILCSGGKCCSAIQSLDSWRTFIAGKRGAWRREESSL
jgi:hypothetical protein